jgi:hypothetical protein
MTAYLARLKTLLAEQPLPEQLTERTEAASVSSVSERGRLVSEGAAASVSSVSVLSSDVPGNDGAETSDDAAIEERAGLAADYVPAVYLDAWAKLNHQKPMRVSKAQWRLALNDGGRFLDQWGWRAADLDWRPNELFVARAGLIWRLSGQLVEGVYYDCVLLASGFAILRQETRGFRA